MSEKKDETIEIGALIVNVCGQSNKESSFVETIQTRWALRMIVWSVFDDFELAFSANDEECKERLYEKAVKLIRGINDYFHKQYPDELPPMFEGSISEAVLKIIADRWAIVNNNSVDALKWPQVETL